MLFGLKGKEAPEFSGIKSWINSKPLTLKKLKKKIVFLDFWTYSCVNCVRTLPHVKELHKKYSKKGLVIIGIHTPEFDFEKKLENVQKAVKRHKLEYPIALDSDNITWKLYGNRYWPRQTVIDSEGKIVYEHVGEGGFEEIENKIVSLLREAGKKVKSESIPRQTEFRGVVSPEIYLGKERNPGFGSSSVCLIDGSCDMYIDPKGQREMNLVYLQGEFFQEEERIHQVNDKEAYVLLKYSARIVNGVLEPYNGKKHKIFVYLDGKPLTKENRGKDVEIEDGKSFVEVDRADMYELVRTKAVETHEIKLVSSSPEFSMYTFTFG